MSINYMKKNKYLKIISIITMVFIIAIMSYIIINKYFKEIEIENQVFSTQISENKQIIYIEQSNIINKYNTLMIPMDTMFEKIFENYATNIETQRIDYNNTTLEVKRSLNIITVENIHEVNGESIDDSVDVEIEETDGVKYIPIYLLSNINGIEVEVDGKKVYDRDKYINSVDAIDKDQTEHTVCVKKVGYISDINLFDSQYVGEDDGALWREEAYKRIEKYRKNDINIIVKDLSGRTIENAIIDLKMTNNDFKFGTAIRMNSKNKKNKYDGITRDLFNVIGGENSFKGPFIYENGSETAQDVCKYAKNNDMYLRGHYLWCDYVYPTLVDLVGTEDDAPEGSMAYIYKKYKDKSISEEEATIQIDNIKKKFETRVLQQLQEEMQEFPDVDEWNVINESISQEYFKYYLYDKNFLTTSKFLTTDERNTPSNYVINEEYNKFLANCFDTARNCNRSAKLAINENKLNGGWTNKQIEDLIKLINNIKQYTNNIDVLGVQYHIKNAHQFSPQAYYNEINYIIEQTGIKEVAITECDNYIASQIGSYSNKEKKQREKYLKDTLIEQYSNQNVSEFMFWVYNSGTGSFLEEERNAYEELIQEWLNDEQNGITCNDGTYMARGYKGEYTATVKINDNILKQVPIKISDSTEKIEIIIGEDEYNDKLANLKNKYTEFENKYNIELNELDDVKSDINKIKQNIQNISNQTKAEFIMNQLEATYDIGNILIENNIDNICELLKDIELIGREYKNILEVNQETIEIDTNNIEDDLNYVIDLIEKNNDLELQDIIELKNLAVNYYWQIENTKNYIKKFNCESAIYLNTYVQTLLNTKIEEYINANPVGSITYSVPAEQFTNENVIATLPQTADMQITSAEDIQSNQEEKRRDIHTFTDNGDFNFTYTRRGKNFEVKATVTNIDKEPPSITGVENGQTYIDKVTPIINDKNLQEVKLYKNDELLPNYQLNTEITEEGIYKLIATDKATNETSIDFRVMENMSEEYKIEDQYILNIKSETTKFEFDEKLKLNIGYKIKRNEKILTNDEIIATGDILETEEGKQYLLIVLGDITKNGKIQIYDLNKLRVCILKNEFDLDEQQKLAADCNLDGRDLNVRDLVRLRILLLTKTT